MKDKITVRFERPTFLQTHPNSPIARVTGFIRPQYFLKIAKVAGLEANPRYAKQSSITKSIQDTIVNSANLLPFKSKGILIGCSNVTSLDRDRYNLVFDENEAEGILDGGHNVFAIIQYLLEFVATEKEIRLNKCWKDGLEALFAHYYDELLVLVTSESERFDFFIPVEILLPVNNDNINVDSFRDHLMEICDARNNNAQLRDETLANQEGIYDYLKSLLPAEIVSEISWKTNDNNRISSRDVTALAWIVLSKLKIDEVSTDFLINKVYNSKADCVTRFSDLITNEAISKKDPKTQRYQLINESVKSALNLVKDLPELYDWLYLNFPDAYNATDGKFGRITCVKNKQSLSKYYQNKLEKYTYPDGFILPLICGVRSLIKEENGIFSWKTDPLEFYKKNLNRLMINYKGLIEMSNYDPQKIGKASSAYSLINDLVGFMVVSYEDDRNV